MELNEDEIIQLIKIIDESEFDELCLETENQRLVLRKKGAESSVQELQPVNFRQMTLGSAKPMVSEETVPLEDHENYASKAPSVDRVEAGLVPVKAPVLGIFYATPRPGAPPFVEEGAPVTENDTVCIIEVMKVFSTVAAGVRGGGRQGVRGAWQDGGSRANTVPYPCRRGASAVFRGMRRFKRLRAVVSTTNPFHRQLPAHPDDENDQRRHLPGAAGSVGILRRSST